MTVWLLIIFLRYEGTSLQTVQLADQSSCERAGKRYVQEASRNTSANFNDFISGYSCTQVKVPAR